jgi:FkbM family methyltransferase
MTRYVALGWHAGEEVRGTVEWQQASGWRPVHLCKPGFAPRTLIDVGAGSGTFALYNAFPDAYRVMIDPLEEHAPDEPPANGEFITTAIGDEVGTVQIQLGRQTLEHSTVSGWRVGREAESREVPVTTLDALWAERGWEPPFGLKIDTEGYEDRVIKGAASLLPETQFVISEVQVADRFRDSYSVAGFFGLLASQGFVLHDILDGHKGVENGGLTFIDALFVRP